MLSECIEFRFRVSLSQVLDMTGATELSKERLLIFLNIEKDDAN